LEDIGDQKWECAHRLFQCVAAASRPLHVKELAEFLAFDFKGGTTPTFLSDWRSVDPKNAVLSTCSSLLAIIDLDGSPVVQFAHFSVKEYLTSPRLAKAKPIISRFHVSMAQAHTVVAQACLGALLHLDENVTKDSLENFPLADYAAEHWAGHARFENVSFNVQDGAKRLFDPKKSHLSVWVWVYDPEDPWSRYQRSERPAKANGTPLHYASFYGMHDVVKFLIIERSQDVNARGFYMIGTPLHVALYRGHLDVAQLLIEHGADAKAKDDNKLTPLHLASRCGHTEVTRVLLEHGADMEARNNNGCTPLLMASVRSHLEVARLLLERGADAEAKDIHGLSPLSWASLAGHVEFVHVLLGHGANIKNEGKDETTPLHIASINGQSEVARVLLKHGADANAQTTNKHTPLHWATEEEVARVLIERGADASALDIKNRTPLHQASEEGRAEVVRILLEHGACANARDANNATPLHLASGPKYWQEEQHFDVVLLLLQYGSNIYARDNEGQTPFVRATAVGREDIMQLLCGAEDHWHRARMPCDKGR